MLQEKMYVRCPADYEDQNNPRIFVCGQILKINPFSEKATIKIWDPFNNLKYFEDLPKGEIELPVSDIEHCSFFIGSEVYANRTCCEVISCNKGKDGFYYYYLLNKNNKTIFKMRETDIYASFNNGKIDPVIQMMRYDLQNPCWYFSRSVVSKSMNILENSIYGFKELAGCKIYLLPHQINTIMRCLQDAPCRYILADEVGMGKTIEALSVLKIYMNSHSNIKILVIVPEQLKEQWKTEMFLKFNIAPGMNKDNNIVEVLSISELDERQMNKNWDFMIVDEIHRYLDDKNIYHKLRYLSRIAENVLLLSATPVQQRYIEYLKLLRIALPSRYSNISPESFKMLIDKQREIVENTSMILNNMDDYIETINDAVDNDKDPHESEECEEIFEDIQDQLEEICDTLNDDKLTALFDSIKFEDDDCSVYKIKVIVSYICSNYQIESNLIRNRRNLIESSDAEERLMPKRELIELSYNLDLDLNTSESLTYEDLSEWIIELSKENNTEIIEKIIRPLLCSFFSSASAFKNTLNNMIDKGFSFGDSLIENSDKWVLFENNIVDNISDIIEDPDAYEEEYSTRILTVINYIYEELYDKKIVLFTSFDETFDVYKKILSKVFDESKISFFSKNMDVTEIEINAYRFQNEEDCKIMLCDYTAGEGRNFQCADYIIHIDLPWEANVIEQRIGRLDRLERDKSRPIVYSVVPHTNETFEEAIFNFWNKGLNIFNQSLSGMEIIMKDINNEIIMAIQKDFKYGLFDRIPEIIDLAKKMKEQVRKEQIFDAASFIYRPMYTQLKRLISYYTENENILFTNAMKDWANLAGFHGKNDGKGIVVYSEHSFSPKSAFNSQLIPPKWNEYMNLKQNLFLSKIQNEYSKRHSRQNVERSIKGTFERKTAIENDYIHFFAPGDEVFDCIVNNAINSCKGQCCAFAVKSRINWIGLIFVWSMSPNEEFLLSKEVSTYALSPYRNYLMSDQLVLPISLVNKDEISDQDVTLEYERMINCGFKGNSIVHLGKRGHETKFLTSVIGSGRNIDWFREKFGTENWESILISSRKEALNQAKELFKKRSDYKGIKEEMERILSARVANSEYYGLDDEELEKLKYTQSVIIEAMRHPKINLESVAFAYMVKADYE